MTKSKIAQWAEKYVRLKIRGIREMLNTIEDIEAECFQDGCKKILAEAEKLKRCDEWEEVVPLKDLKALFEGDEK